MNSSSVVTMGRVTAPPAGIASRRFARGYVITMRPYLMFVSGITGLAGLALAPAIPIANTLILALAFFLSYGFGQALTDCFQLDTDSLSAPYRPLVKGEIRRRDVLRVSLIGLLAIAAVFAGHNPLNVPLAATAVAGLATYTYFKRRWWAGPFYNAWIVAVLALIGYLSGLGSASGGAAPPLAVAGTLTAVFFGYANFVLAGYYKDISADRATGYHTLPVRFGLGISARISDAFAALAVLAAGLAVRTALAGTASPLASAAAALFLAAGTATAVAAQVRLHSVRCEASAHRAISPIVHAYILLLAAVAAAQKPLWIFGLLLFYAAFLATMKRRPMKEQI